MRRAGLANGALAGWIGRLLLLGAVAFWWGGIVVPRLLSLSSSALIPPDALPRSLDPEFEGTIANSVSAAALVVLGLLAFANAVGSFRMATGRIAVGGWLVMTLTAAFLAWEELSDFHTTGLTEIERSVFGTELDQEFGAYVWVPLLSPLAAAFVLTMGLFIFKGLRRWDVRACFVFGLTAWMSVLALEMSSPIFLARVAQSRILGVLLEETLEFSGTLFMSLGAATALRGPPPPAVRNVFGGLRGRMVLGWAIAMLVLGGVLALWVIRAPFVESRGPTTHIDTFAVRLRSQDAAVQEIQMPAAPVSRVRLRLGVDDRNDYSGTLGVRFTRLGTAAPELSGGVGQVPGGVAAGWLDIDLAPPLAEPQGQPLAMWVVADTEPGAILLLGASKTNPYPDGGLWINGERAWSDQDLEFVLYSAAEPTLSKLSALWETVTSGWRRMAAVGELTVALVGVTMTPALLLAAVFPLRRRAT